MNVLTPLVNVSGQPLSDAGGCIMCSFGFGASGNPGCWAFAALRNKESTRTSVQNIRAAVLVMILRMRMMEPPAQVHLRSAGAALSVNLGRHQECLICALRRYGLRFDGGGRPIFEDYQRMEPPRAL